MSENNQEPTAEEKSYLEQIVRKVDYDLNGEINYSEFLSGTLDEIHFSQDNLYLLFKQLDTFNEENISKESLLKTFNRSSKNYTEEQIEWML
mmetsp:Transcript_14511/g.14122  ORF Transcript_14511/g.14122 Transcript_14511/m.14122 type:complete len:92 (-) Transcript_14511:142-417(-)